jgi:hypothetical protein
VLDVVLQLVDLLNETPADEDIPFFVDARDQAVQERANHTPVVLAGKAPETG